MWKTDLSTPLNSPKDHVSSAIMFQVLLVTHFCTCEIGCVGVDYLEWDFSEQSSRHCPGACPTHACLMAVICEWDRTRSAHCASLMKTGRFSSDQAWNSQVVCPWHFSSVQIGMCGVMRMRGRRTESQRASEGEKERIMLFLFQRPCCPKLAKVYGNQTGRGQMKWFGTVALLPMWDCCSSI